MQRPGLQDPLGRNRLVREILDIENRQNLVAMDLRYNQHLRNVYRHPRNRGQIEDDGKDDVQGPRFSGMSVNGDALSYIPDAAHHVGVYIAEEPLTRDDYYFEVTILDVGVSGTIGIGLVHKRYPLDSQPGWRALSVGYHADDGRLYKASGFGKPFGPKSQAGDKIGCGIKFPSREEDAGPLQNVKVFFTHNGKEIGVVMIPYPASGLHPAVGMHSDGEEVSLNLDAEWLYEDLILMAIDSGEEEWSRLHDVKLNGMTLEYTGRGKSIHDVGLAQARSPLDTTFHYYEIEIIDPGENCYIAIGLARRNYPQHRHPGWNRGSIAYHADDGKIFLGTGVGDPFGPKCNKGDVMGCGIQFPPDYDSEADSDLSPEEPEVSNGDIRNYIPDHEDLYDDSDDDDDDWGMGERHHPLEQGTTVEVFFTRNGQIIGRRQISIPKGGFYPTVGMLSSCEKVRIDLRPLTG